MVDLTELFVHWEAGRSQVQISDSLRLDRKTIRKYLAPAIEAGLTPGGEPAGEVVWRARIAQWFPAVAAGKVNQLTGPAIQVHRDYIVEQLAAGVTVSTISARLIAEKGLDAYCTIRSAFGLSFAHRSRAVSVWNPACWE